MVDTITPPRSDTLNDSLENNSSDHDIIEKTDLTTTDEAITAPNTIIADEAMDEANMSNIDDDAKVSTVKAKFAFTTKIAEDAMEAEST